jgi:hypothetical protein
MYLKCSLQKEGFIVDIMFSVDQQYPSPFKQ